MTREIKFRIYDTKRKEWIHDTEHAVHLLGETILLGGFLIRKDGTRVGLADLNDLVVMQYTGFKDKNGKEIFEKDFIGGLYEGYIDWCDIQKGWQLFIKDFECMACLCDVLFQEFFEDENLEVTGNVYDHPHLLEKSQ